MKERLTKVKVDEMPCFMCHIRPCKHAGLSVSAALYIRVTQRHSLCARPLHTICEQRDKLSIPKFRPTMQCHVALYFLSNSFLMNAAMSFSMLYRSRACRIQQTILPASYTLYARNGARRCCTQVLEARTTTQYLCCAVNGVCLHVLRHVSVLNHGFPLRHDATVLWRPRNRELAAPTIVEREDGLELPTGVRRMDLRS